MVSVIRVVRAAAVALVVLAVVAATASAAVSIRRTEFGIPHIKAFSYHGLGYGYGYAFAEDNACEVANLIVTVSGERSRWFGPEADSEDTNGFEPSTNLESDTYFRWVNQSGVVGELWAKPEPLGPSPELRRLVRGYVAGYNRYLEVTGVENLSDSRCAGAGWVRPMTAADMWRILYDANQVTGLTSFKHEIGAAAPAAPGPAPAAGAAALPRLGTPPARGSNGVALGKAATAAGDGMLLANPHFPWVGPGRSYQVQLTIPGRLNVSGASFYGTPVVEIGHTEQLAWTHTITPAQHFTLYELQLDPSDSTKYVVDGETESMTATEIEVPTEAGTIHRTVYSTRWGPVLSKGWSGESAFALQGSNAANLRSFDEWLAMGRAQSVAELREAQDSYQGMPFVYTIAADSSGAAYLTDSSVVPNVPDALAAECVDTPAGEASYPALTILDGSRSDCEWGSDPDGLEPGIFGPANQPALEREDYVENSNDSPWLSNPAQPLSYPRIYGDSDTERRLRTRLGIELIEERLPGGITPAELRSLVTSNRNESAELGRDSVVEMCTANPTLIATDGSPVDVTDACEALAGWDLTAQPESRGEILWRGFWIKAFELPNLWTTPFDPLAPLSTPAGLNTADPGLRRAFADAVQELAGWGLAADAPLAEMQFTEVGGTRTPVPGCTEQEGCFDITCVTEHCAYGQVPGGPFGQIDYGSSFIMAVELTPDGPHSKTILTYSESTDPSSPHRNDQTELFATGGWVKERFSEYAINHDPELTVTPLPPP